MRVYRFHTRDIPTGDMSHLRGQLLTGDARRVPMARLYEKSSLIGRHSCDVVAAHYVEMRRSQRGTRLN